MANTAATLPGTGADDAAVGTITWLNPTYIQADDASFASATSSSGSGWIPTHYLKGTNFGFAIPAGATIDGIVLDIHHKSSQLYYVYDKSVYSVKGGVVGGTNRYKISPSWAATEETWTYGSSTELWGQSWTPSDINASNFGFVLAANVYYSPAYTAYVDCFKVTIYYTEAGAAAKTQVRIF